MVLDRHVAALLLVEMDVDDWLPSPIVVEWVPSVSRLDTGSGSSLSQYRDPDDGGGQLDNRLHCTDPSLERANTHRVYFCMLPSHARTYSLFKGTLYAL